jgi:hypothetical protein
MGCRLDGLLLSPNGSADSRHAEAYLLPLENDEAPVGTLRLMRNHMHLKGVPRQIQAAATL